MITNKIKSILSLKGFSFADYARKLDITPQSLQTKAKKDAYKIKDLLKLAELTDTRLCFVDKKTGDMLIKFDCEDIKKEV